MELKDFLAGTPFTVKNEPGNIFQMKQLNRITEIKVEIVTKNGRHYGSLESYTDHSFTVMNYLFDQRVEATVLFSDCSIAESYTETSL